MTYTIEYAYISHIGKRRANNEDNFWCEGRFLPAENTGMTQVVSGVCEWSDFPVFAVFDGMGGESSGELAASVATQKLQEILATQKNEGFKNPEEFLKQSCQKMNQAVLDAETANHIDSMGSTLAMLMVDRKSIYSANLGDSRMYRYHEGKLERISEDHVFRVSYGKPPLLQYLGLDEEGVLLEPTIRRIHPKKGDWLLLCTDGLTDMLNEEQISEILSKEESSADAVRKLLDAALEEGGRDNITIVLCKMPERRSVGAAWKKFAETWRKGKS